MNVWTVLITVLNQLPISGSIPQRWNISLEIYWFSFDDTILRSKSVFRAQGPLKQQKKPNCQIGYKSLLFSSINSIHSISLFSALRLHSSLPKTFCSATMGDNGQPCSDSFFICSTHTMHAQKILLFFCPVPVSSHPYTHSDPCLNPEGRNLFKMFLIQLECNRSYLLGQRRHHFQ